MTNISAISQHKTVNLMRLFKRRLVSGKEIRAIVKHLSDEERCLGTLPADWFGRRKTDKEKKEMTKEIFKAFSFFAKGVYSKINASEYIFESFIRFLKQDLKEITRNPASVEYAGRGLFGKVFRLKIKGKEYAIKVFHMSDKLNDNHGKGIEIANAINYSHTKNRRYRADFYFGKIAGENDMDGFIVTEFVPGIIKETNDKPRRYAYGRFFIEDALRGHNTINGKLVDFGEIKRIYPNKKAEEMAKQLLEALNKGEFPKIKKLITKYKKEPEYRVVAEDILNRYWNIKGNFHILYKEHTDSQRAILDFWEKQFMKQFKIKAEP